MVSIDSIGMIPLGSSQENILRSLVIYFLFVAMNLASTFGSIAVRTHPLANEFICKYPGPASSRKGYLPIIWLIS
jgi:hypothetical protein